jgi:D-ribose pyranose/furanose isomerase RbsD
MLEAQGINKYMHMNRARIAAEFESEHPEIVENLEREITNWATSGHDEVIILLDTEEYKSVGHEFILLYLEYKGYYVEWANSGKKVPYRKNEYQMGERLVYDSVLIRF